jgi:hypothetical protein
LYETSLVGLGDGISGHSPHMWEGTANPLVSQNNILLCYQVQYGKWFRIPNLGASAWVLFDKQGDSDELYVGEWGGAVMLEDNDEGFAEVTGDSGFCNASAINTLVKDTSHRTWVADEWIGASVTKDGGGTAEETRIVLDNDTTTLTIDGVWVVAPAVDMLFTISKQTGTITSETGTSTGSRAYYASTATGGGASSIVDTLIGITPVTNDIVVLRPGLATEEWRVLTGYVAGSKTMVFLTSWIVNPSPADVYQVWQSLKNTSKSWTVDEHAGKLLFLRTGTATAEFATIVHNSSNVLMCKLFNGVLATTDWTVNPAVDAYQIYENTAELQEFDLTYKTPMLHFGNMAALKRWFDVMIRALGDTILTINWTIDGNDSAGGTITIDLTTTGARFDEAIFDTDVFSDVSTRIQEANFADNAEGFFLQMQFNAKSKEKFQLDFWTIGFTRYTGAVWAR